MGHSSERSGQGLEAQPGGGEDPGWRGLGRPPLVLGKAGPGPLLQRGEEVQAQGVCGSWGVWAPRLARARVGVGNGLTGVGGEGIKTPQDSGPVGHLTLLSPVARGCPWVKTLLRQRFRWVETSQAPPVSKASPG